VSSYLGKGFRILLSSTAATNGLRSQVTAQKNEIVCFGEKITGHGGHEAENCPGFES
jgi:hypothetical protein